MDKCFTGVALVTNAGCDLGAAVALGLLKAGCRRIALADGSTKEITAIKGRCDSIAKDAQICLIQHESNEASDFETMAMEAAKSFGEINYCINCSTTNVVSKPTAELEPELFKAGLMSSSRAMWLCCRAELRQILSQPRDKKAKNSIVSIIPYGNGGSHQSHVVLAASGYSRVGMIKSMARDHLADGVRLNAVCPALSNSKEDQEGNIDTLRSHMRIPGRLIEVEEIADAAIFMASENSSGINGVALPVDAGWCMVHN